MASGTTEVNDWQTVDSPHVTDWQAAAAPAAPAGFLDTLHEHYIKPLVQFVTDASNVISPGDEGKEARARLASIPGGMVNQFAEALKPLGGSGAADRAKNGSFHQFVRSAAGAIPVVGAGIVAGGDEASRGEYGAAAADMLGTVGQAAIPEAIAKVPGAVRSVIAAPGAVKAAIASVDPSIAADALGLISPRAAHAAAAVSKLRNIAAKLRTPTPVPDVAVPQPAPGSMTIQPEARVSAAAIPQPAQAVPGSAANPYFAGGSTVNSGALVSAAQRAAEGQAAVAPPAPAAPAPVEAPVTTPYDKTASTLADTYKANAAKADEVKAQWMFDHGITADQLKPGAEYKKLVDQIPNPNAKSNKFVTRVNDADHPARVQAVADLLDAKHMQAQAQTTAVALDKAGTSPADAAGMTPEQLGVKTKTAAANVVFELQKLNAAKVAAAQAAP